MEHIIVLDSENCAVRDNKMKGDKVERRTSMGNGQRKRLADISNLPQESKLVSQHENLKSSSLTTNEYIEQLRKENLTLMKVLADRNKVIELSGIELQKLRLTVHKLQQQNIQLAQTNSQMSAELNSGKDKQKALHHQLGCTNALLHAIKLELEEKTKLIMSQITGMESKVEVMECAEAAESSQANNGDNKLNNTNRRRQSRKPSLDPNAPKAVEGKDRPSVRRSKRFISEEPERHEAVSEEPKLDLGSTTVKPLTATKDSKRLCLGLQSSRLESDEPETTALLPERDGIKPIEQEKLADNKRLCSRRQSARPKSDEPQPSEHLIEIDDTEPVEAEKKAGNKRPTLRRQSMRFKPEEPESEPEVVIEAMSEDPKPSLGMSSSTNVQPVKAKQNKNKRHSTKRQSVRVKSEKCEPNQDIFEIDNAKFPMSEEPEPELEAIEAMSEDPEPSLGMTSTTNAQPVKAKQNKRHSTKKLSVRVKPEECEPNQDKFEIDDTKFPIPPQNLEHGSAPQSSLKNEDAARSKIIRDEGQEFTRLSMGRPSRRAAEKVQSYKEIPLNVKMRRRSE